MTERDNVTTAERLPTIVIKDLYKSYGEKKVLKGLNLEVFEGELFGFIGRNGIGKSTTIDCMIGAKQFNGGTTLSHNRSRQNVATDTLRVSLRATKL